MRSDRTRRALALVVAAVGALAVVAPPAVADAPRTVQGQVLVPTAKADGVGLLWNHARCAYLAGGQASQGLAGTMIALTHTEGDGSRRFDAIGTNGNVDVVFFESLGACPGPPGAVVTGIASGPGDEAGAVPVGSRYALVVAREGVAVGFTFTIG